MKKLFAYFLQGLLLIAPMAIIVYILYSLFVTIDGWLHINIEQLIGFSVPGLGVLTLFISLTVLGYLGQTAIVRPVKRLAGNIIKKIPLLNLLYTSFSDLFSAFVGKEKKFNIPVKVLFNRENNLWKMGFITKVVEKPAIPRSNLALVGLYRIRETEMLFACLSNIITNNIKSHDEFNLTDALECMIEGGILFKEFRVGNWFDCGRKESLLASNSILLEKFGGSISESNNFENTIFIPPVSVAEGCNIKDSIIGPHVAIGENTLIQSSIIKASIIGSFSKLYNVVLNDSLIGNDTEVIGEKRSLNIGDNTEIDLG